MEPWQRQIIRSLFPYSASRMRIEDAFRIKHPHVPEFLYKYRQFNPCHLDALRRGVLYMSSPDRFNDPFDTTIFFDPERFIVEDFSVEEFIQHAKDIEQSVQSGVPWRPKPINNPVKQGDWIRRVIAGLLEKERNSVRDAIIQFAQDYLTSQDEALRQRMHDHLRKGFSVLSLCANPTSVLMWSHYSNSHRGFCIEYDFANLPADDLRRRLCFPVFYRAKMTDATPYMANSGSPRFNSLFGNYLCLLKSKGLELRKGVAHHFPYW